MTFLRKHSRAKVPLLLVCAALTLAVQEKRSPLSEKEKHPQALPATGARKPNIVLMLTDNLGYGELGVYGGGILRGASTPRIDKLAGESTRLLNFNVEAQCTPSRSALMTGRLPTNRGFDEWYGIPRTYNEVFWPSLNDTHSLWPSVGQKQGWDPSLVPAEPIYEARKGEKPRKVAELDLDHRRAMEKEITTRAVEFIKRTASSGKPFFAYVSFSLFHMPTLPNPEFAGKTGNGDWADCLAEMDYRTGQILDAIKEAGVEDNTIVIFTSDNGPEATHPWEGDSGPWRGTYFTAMEASLRAPFVIRWPGKIPAGRVSNEIVHIVDLFTTLAHLSGAEIPQDRPIDGVDQMDFFLGKQEKSNREGFPAYVADRLQAVKWRNWKMHLIWQENMYDAPQRLPLPKIINLLTDLKEQNDVLVQDGWVTYPMMKILNDFQESLKKYPPIKMGTPDPYQPPTE